MHNPGDTEGLLREDAADELWLISYADLLTLLIGFFVLLIAVSPVKLARFEQMVSSINGKAPPPLVELKAEVDAYVEKAGLHGKVSTREDADGLAIEFKDALLFDSASADLRSEGAGTLEAVAKKIAELPTRSVLIEGHTDDVPISTPRFASNWELSSQRAINVRASLEAAGVRREVMSVRGFADTRALPPGQLPAGGSVEAQRAANRRVVIRVE